MARLRLLSGTLLALISVQPSFAAGVEGVAFPSSCSASAQIHLERGVAHLHSFQYEEAALEFDTARDVDRSCSMSYWGKAMTRVHPLWGERPTADAMDLGRRDTAAARRAGNQSPLENGYITASSAFYDAPPTASHRDRLRAWSRAFARLHRAFPEDDNATAFYALSLLALGADGVNDRANRRAAIRLLEPSFQRQPGHPGIVHYLVHATDHPEFAARGLNAARVYADIAPTSSHALHMPSHTFVRLGMWSEAIASNLRAATAGEQAVLHHVGDYTYQIHAMEFLNHAYLQIGQEAKAREQHARLATVPGASESEKRADLALFIGRAAVELHAWTEAASLPVPDLDPSWLSEVYWTRTVGAARLGDPTSARQNRALYARSVQALLEGRGANVSLPASIRIAQFEADGWIAFAEGHPREALRLLRKAARVEAAEAGESVTVPAREMLADLLWETGRSEQALREYRLVLRTSPNRFNSLVGAGRVAHTLGQSAVARTYFGQVLAMVSADADRQELAEVRRLAATP